MLILCTGRIRSVLEYCCIAFDRMAATHMLKLERIQYRCLRIALGLMQSTHVQTLENHKYLISVFSTGGHPLRRLLALRYYTCPMSTMWWSRNRVLLEGTLAKWRCLGWCHRRRRYLILHRYFSLMVQRAGQVSVLVYIILVVPSPTFVLGNQVECLLRTCRRFLWLAVLVDTSS
jgi:hypothetical protein